MDQQQEKQEPEEVQMYVPGTFPPLSLSLPLPDMRAKRFRVPSADPMPSYSRRNLHPLYLPPQPQPHRQTALEERVLIRLPGP
jgi:hypothetical protein